jgi:hypothetical protein
MLLFTQEYQLGLSSFTRNFFRELSGRCKPPFVFGFDNYHEIDTHSKLHDSLQQACTKYRQEVGGFLLVEASRRRHLPLSGLSGTWRSLQWEELRFTRNEVNILAKRLAPCAP